MTRDNMTQMLSEAICVTPEDARTALEASEWNLRDAAQRLLHERACARKAERVRSGEDKDIGLAIHGLIARFSRRPAPAAPR